LQSSRIRAAPPAFGGPNSQFAGALEAHQGGSCIEAQRSLIGFLMVLAGLLGECILELSDHLGMRYGPRTTGSHLVVRDAWRARAPVSGIRRPSLARSAWRARTLPHTPSPRWHRRPAPPRWRPGRRTGAAAAACHRRAAAAARLRRAGAAALRHRAGLRAAAAAAAATSLAPGTRHPCPRPSPARRLIAAAGRFGHLPARAVPHAQRLVTRLRRHVTGEACRHLPLFRLYSSIMSRSRMNCGV